MFYLAVEDDFILRESDADVEWNGGSVVAVTRWGKIHS